MTDPASGISQGLPTGEEATSDGTGGDGGALRPPVPRPGERWRQALAARASARSTPGGTTAQATSLEPHMFQWSADDDARLVARPARRRALEALPEGGAVLDVGVGGGAASLSLAPRAGLIVGVDVSQGMLDLFRATAAVTGAAIRAVLGPWPEVADTVEPADVVICHHAVYGVAEIEAFVTALTARARHRVVLEVTEHPPLWRFDPLWRTLHGVELPDWPVADHLEAVLRSMGLAVTREDCVPPPRPQDLRPQFLDFIRQRLGVGPGRDPEIVSYLRALKPWTERYVALWWPGSA